MYVPDQPGAVGSGFEVDPGQVRIQAKALGEVGDETRNVHRNADQIGSQRPMLGTSLPAMAFGQRLAAIVGEAGLSGELARASARLDQFQKALASSSEAYRQTESDSASSFRKA